MEKDAFNYEWLLHNVVLLAEDLVHLLTASAIVEGDLVACFKGRCLADGMDYQGINLSHPFWGSGPRIVLNREGFTVYTNKERQVVLVWCVLKEHEQDDFTKEHSNRGAYLMTIKN